MRYFDRVKSPEIQSSLPDTYVNISTLTCTARERIKNRLHWNVSLTGCRRDISIFVAYRNGDVEVGEFGQCKLYAGAWFLGISNIGYKAFIKKDNVSRS